MPQCTCGHQAKLHDAVVVVEGVETLPCRACECCDYERLNEMSSQKIELQIFDSEEFKTIWILHVALGISSPLGKQWKRMSTAKKWAEKMKREYEEQGFTVTIKVVEPKLHVGVITL